MPALPDPNRRPAAAGVAAVGLVPLLLDAAVTTHPRTKPRSRLDARLADLTEAGKPEKLQWYLEKHRRGARVAWLAWSRYRVVLPTWDRKLGTLLACLGRDPASAGGRANVRL